MSSKFKPENIDVVILCGGLGRRLKSIVNDRPKPMALIANRPFLDILIDYIAHYGFKRFILCVGYMGGFIKQYYKNWENLQIVFSEEKIPLGTAGALKNAEPFIKSSPFLVFNGDSFSNINLKNLINFHIKKKASVSMVIRKTNRTEDFGMIRLGQSERIIKFNEKIKKSRQFSSAYINSGIYIFEKDILLSIPEDTIFSLEIDFFPTVLKNYKIFGYRTNKVLFDIGTPNRYRSAKEFLKRINSE